MDAASKSLLQRDLFVQGILLMCQEKVLPSDSTLKDALHQARATEEQHKQLSDQRPIRPASDLPSDPRAVQGVAQPMQGGNQLHIQEAQQEAMLAQDKLYHNATSVGAVKASYETAHSDFLWVRPADGNHHIVGRVLV